MRRGAKPEKDKAEAKLVVTRKAPKNEDSRPARRCNEPSMASCATTTPSARIKAIASAVARPPRWCGVWRRNELFHHHSGPPTVSTPFRVWTV
jgi:hypothetical protein